MNIYELSKEELIQYITSLNEGESGKLGLVWDKERVPEEIVLQCKENIPVLENISSKNISVGDELSLPTNLLIEGDNFHSLSVLSYTHFEDIDVIYIDPPYNTGKEDFIYNDKFVDVEDGYKHSKWLNFMDKRLRIARILLKDSGIICISIDENEYAQLKLLCDSIFGEMNRLSTHHIQVRYPNKTMKEKSDWQPIMEYVLIYAKEKSLFKANRPSQNYSIDKFIYEFKELSKGKTFKIGSRKVTVFKQDEWKIIKHNEPAVNLLKDTWVSGQIYSGTGNGDMVRKVIEPRLLKDGYGSLYKIDGLGEDGIGYRYFTSPRNAKSKRCKMYSGIPTIVKEELTKGKASKSMSISNYHDYCAEFGNIRLEGGVSFNNGKKPIKLIKELINYHTNKNATILDFFAGSGSTGHAVMELNSEDMGNRKFILCTSNEVDTKTEKLFVKKHNISNSQLIKWKKDHNSKWVKFIEKEGICSTVTYPRLLNVINGYNNKKGLNGKLRYYKTEFVKNSGAKDQLYYDLTAKCIPMLCIKENTFVLVEKNDEFMIYANDSNTRFTCVYFDAYGINYDRFINRIVEIKDFKSLYIFTLGNDININELIDVENYIIEPIPYRILEFYKKIIEIGRAD